MLIAMGMVGREAGVYRHHQNLFLVSLLAAKSEIEAEDRYVCAATTATLALTPDFGVVLARLWLVLQSSWNEVSWVT